VSIAAMIVFPKEYLIDRLVNLPILSPASSTDRFIRVSIEDQDIEELASAGRYLYEPVVHCWTP
jgi:hypothetical protein